MSTASGARAGGRLSVRSRDPRASCPVGLGHNASPPGRPRRDTGGMRARVVAAAAVLVAVAAVAFAAWVRTLPGVEGSWLTAGYGTDVAAGLLAVAWTVTGAVLLALRPRNALGWLVVVVGVCQALQQGLAAYGGYGVGFADRQWPLAHRVAWLSTGLWLPGLLPARTCSSARRLTRGSAVRKRGGGSVTLTAGRRRSRSLFRPLPASTRVGMRARRR